MPRPDHMIFPGVGRIFCDPRSRLEVDFIFKEIFEHHAYLRHGIALEPEAVVFDVGANVGLFALYAHKQCRGTASVYAFEPAPMTFGFLERNAAEHGFAARGRLFNLGLTSTGAGDTAILTFFPGLPGNSTFHPEGKNEQIDLGLENYLATLKRDNPGIYPLLSRLAQNKLDEMAKSDQVSCRMSTLSAICGEHRIARIDLLKIDVEGAEMEVLGGIDDETWSLIRQVVMEAHDRDGRIEDLRSLLVEQGFVSVVIERPDWCANTRRDNHNLYARRGA